METFGGLAKITTSIGKTVSSAVPTIVAFHTPPHLAAVAMFRHASDGAHEYQGPSVTTLHNEGGAQGHLTRAHAAGRGSRQLAAAAGSRRPRQYRYEYEVAYESTTLLLHLYRTRTAVPVASSRKLQQQLVWIYLDCTV